MRSKRFGFLTVEQSGDARRNCDLRGETSTLATRWITSPGSEQHLDSTSAQLEVLLGSASAAAACTPQHRHHSSTNRLCQSPPTRIAITSQRLSLICVWFYSCFYFTVNKPVSLRALHKINSKSFCINTRDCQKILSLDRRILTNFFTFFTNLYESAAGMTSFQFMMSQSKNRNDFPCF